MNLFSLLNRRETPITIGIIGAGKFANIYTWAFLTFHFKNLYTYSIILKNCSTIDFSILFVIKTNLVETSLSGHLSNHSNG